MGKTNTLRDQIQKAIEQYDKDQNKAPMTGDLVDYILSVPLVNAAHEMFKELENAGYEIEKTKTKR